MKHCTFFQCIALVAVLLFGTSSGVNASTSLANASGKPSMNSAYSVTNVSYTAWQYAQIPASNFLADATSAEITVKGAVFVAFGYSKGPWNFSDYSDGVFNWSDSNVAGVTYKISGDVLATAKKGELYIRTDKSEGLTMTVKNIGEGGSASEETPEETPGEVEEPAEEPNATVEYSTNLYEWNDIKVSTDAFNANASSATLSVKGACYVKLSHKVNGQLSVIKEYSWSDGNRSGVTYEISGDILADAKNGNLYIYVGGGNPVTLDIVNTVSAVEPDEPVVEPDEPVVEPDEPVVEPDEPVVEPDEPVVEPDEPVVEPDEPVVEPDEPVVEPDEPVVEPDEPVVEPDEPVVEPDEPVVEPDEPVVEPDEPVVEPDEPVVEPDEPVVEPDEPVVEPDEPVVEPDEPVVEPDEPVVEPDEPVVEPDEPVVEPDEPTVEPDEPAVEEPTYGILNSYQMTLWEWNNIQVPVSAFDAKAEDVKLVIAGASCVKYMVGSEVVADFPWSDNTKYGAILQLTADQLKAALNGNIYVWVGGGNPITLDVVCYGMGGKPEPLRDPSTLDMTNFGDRSYAIAHKYQLTDVPTLYLTVPDAVGKDINTVLFKDRSTNTAEYHGVTVQVVDGNGSLEEFTDDAEIKVRGNSTAECMKKPYRIKFPKKHKHDMLGKGNDARNWVLLANFLDPAMIRNALSYHIGKEVGMAFCPGYQFVDVVINDEYRGTYQVTDQIEVGKKRINVNEDTGWYIEVSRIDMIEDPCLIAGSLPMSIKNPEPATDAELAVLKTEVEDWFSNVSRLFFSYNQAAFTDPETGWRAYFDEESLVNYYIAVNLAGDYDGFMTVKMYREADGKMFVGPLWDKDLSAGNYEDGTKLIEEHNNGQFVNYLNVLLRDPGFVQKVNDKLADMVANGIDKSIQKYIDKIDAKIAKTEVLNHTKWAGYTSWKLSFDTHADAIAQLRDYFTKRIPFLVEKLGAKSQAAAKQNTFATSISLVGQDVAVYAGNGTLTVASDGGESVPVYSVSGVEVARPASGQTISLPAGTYLVGGKKVVVK